MYDFLKNFSRVILIFLRIFFKDYSRGFYLRNQSHDFLGILLKDQLRFFRPESWIFPGFFVKAEKRGSLFKKNFIIFSQRTETCVSKKRLQNSVVCIKIFLFSKIILRFGFGTKFIIHPAI